MNRMLVVVVLLFQMNCVDAYCSRIGNPTLVAVTGVIGGLFDRLNKPHYDRPRLLQRLFPRKFHPTIHEGSSELQVHTPMYNEPH